MEGTVRMFSPDQSQRPTAQEMVGIFENWMKMNKI